MIPLESFLPQGEIISVLSRQLRDGTMTHALLITGETGVGKWTLARALAASLLCDQPEDKRQPCGKCKACEETEALTHPDLTVLQLGAPLVPTETKTSIPVTDVEELIRRIGRKGFQNPRRVVIIRRAEDMNTAAQNKLLKTLEEPPEDVFFLLTCRNAEKLLPTIVSRCRMLLIHPWDDGEILRVLEENGFSGPKAQDAVREAGGSFGQALSIMGDGEYWAFREEVIRDFLGTDRRSDIFRISSAWKDRKDESERLFSVLDRLISRMMHYSLALSGGDGLESYPPVWKDFAERAEISDYAALMEAVSLARRRTQSSVSFQAVTEQLILSLMEEVF